MVKPIVFTAPASTNTVTKGRFVEVSGGYVRNYTATSNVAIGVAVTDKDANNNVGIVDDALMKLPSIEYNTYTFGDIVYARVGGIAKAGSTYKAGFVAETVTAGTSDAVLVRLMREQN